MRVAVGADHAGLDIKAVACECLARHGYEVDDLGTHSREPVDYPDFAAAVARAVLTGSSDRGVLICGSGDLRQQAPWHPCGALP